MGTARVKASLIVPVFNEAQRVASTLDSLAAGLGAVAPLEILVVDDGSTDGTADAAARHAAAWPLVRVLRQAANRGKGAAVRLGMRQAAGECCGFIDGDLPLALPALAAMLERLADADVVIASRQIDRGTRRPPAPWSRRIASRGFNWLVRRQFGLPYLDTQCGVKCFRREAARAIFGRSRIDSFAFDVEVLALARYLGLRILEMPVDIQPSGLSTVSLARHALPVLRDLRRLHANLRRGVYEAPEALAGAPDPQPADVTESAWARPVS